MKLTFKNLMKTKNKWGGFENNCQGGQNGELMTILVGNDIGV